jgi:glycosyltransferase involved in cell wall biosynthesis
VSFVVDSDTWGGAEVYVVHHGRRAGVNGWEAAVVCSELVAGPMQAALPATTVSTVRLARHTGAAPQIRTALEAQRPDAVLVNMVDPASNAAALEAALSVAPTVATLHLVGDVDRSPALDDLRSLYARAAGVISPSEEGRRQLVDVLGVRQPRAVVVSNGVDIPADVPSRPSNTVPVVGALGRLTPQKGFDVLLAGFRLLIEKGIDLRVSIGGEGRESESLTRQAADLPVTFEGFVHDPSAFLGRLDLFCLPSRREALPLALLEAMARGLPCIATDVGGIGEELSSAVVLVPPENPHAVEEALRALLADPGLRRRLGQRARTLVSRRFGADLMARRTFSLLDAATDGHAR